jgi:uncharacterized protein YndB with AHSA1/START domain
MNEPLADVRLVKVIPAPRREAFEAWLDPEALRRFMCPAEGSSVAKVEVDPRVGGAFLIVMRIGDQDLPHHGRYLEIERHERLVFSWLSAVAGSNSRVTLTFADTPDGQTLLTLEHVGLEGDEIRAKHHAGWTRILAELAGATGS